jgi:hypothetical protein
MEDHLKTLKTRRDPYFFWPRSIYGFYARQQIPINLVAQSI